MNNKINSDFSSMTDNDYLTMINGWTEDFLILEIEKHNRLYWELNSPEISDEKYDILLNRLHDINPRHPLLEFVGGLKQSEMGEINDSENSMISLEKTYYFKDAPKGKKNLMKWLEELSRSNDELFLIQPKYDGISARFKNGILATRGQDTADQNISDKVPLIELESDNYKGKLDRDVRGEIVIRNDDFETIYSNIQKNDGSRYKNQRNAVAGILSLKDISVLKKQGAKLTLVDYSLISFSVKFSLFEQKWLQILEKIEALPYPMDGIVVKLADLNYRDSLGYTAHHPRGQIAFKFSGMRKSSSLIDVEWSFGKNNLTPVGRIEPVEIGGVTISNVTLHNIGMVEKNDWQIGDLLTIERAGEVIPHVVSSEKGVTRKPFIISDCPACSNKLIRNDKELLCVNPDCPGTYLQKFLASVKSFEIEELGEPTLKKIISDLNVKTIPQLFELKVNDLLKLDGFKIKSATNLFKSIQSARKTTDYQILASLNIDGVGQNVAKKILTRYRLEEVRKLSLEQLLQLEQIGPVLSENIYKSLKEKSSLLDEIITRVEFTDFKESSNSINRKTICFTGKMPEKRDYYEKIAIERGFLPVDDVNKELSLLVVADLNSESSKSQKAKKYNVNVVDLNQWLKSKNFVLEDIVDTNEDLLPGFNF